MNCYLLLLYYSHSVQVACVPDPTWGLGHRLRYGYCEGIVGAIGAKTRAHIISLVIDLLAILQASESNNTFIHFYTRGSMSGVRASILSVLNTFENSTKCNEISLNIDSFSE